ncbi:MAG: signal peptidase I [Candidatus Glassbacteria bacterium]
MKKKALFSFLILLLITAGLRIFVFSIWNVPGEVMYPLIHGNQKVMVLENRWFTPKRGDIVIFCSEAKGRSYIRRIIAVEGESLSIRGNDVFINGEILYEPYRFVDADSESCEFPKFISLTIPRGEFFVMGDNRYAPSDFDSRVDGTINEDQIQGKVIYIF